MKREPLRRDPKGLSIGIHWIYPCWRMSNLSAKELPMSKNIFSKNHLKMIVLSLIFLLNSSFTQVRFFGKISVPVQIIPNTIMFSYSGNQLVFTTTAIANSKSVGGNLNWRIAAGCGRTQTSTINGRWYCSSSAQALFVNQGSIFIDSSSCSGPTYERTSNVTTTQIIANGCVQVD